ncbi:AraC family transcriptional regulator [Paenibacillus antri]|uniref:AraC family transcriptional regulator n=1 Tax=Paenibacillus antri TaxID=2582848 RepID=A0A5R9G5N1_9BACL|nr:AraC family transcriptional regulator [Paenibacillus antri]TLS51677.1 AraC family transcriptional regulator [Paenibacillus antri]
MVQSLKKWLAYTLTNTQTRLVLFLTVSVCIIIMGVSATSYYTSKSVLQSELSEPQHQMLQISMNFIDDYIEKADQIAVSVALHSNVYTFLTADNQNSYTNISGIYEFFSTLIGNTSYIDSIYVYDTERGSFVSMPQGYSSSKVTFPDSEWVGIAGEFGDKKMLVRKRSVPPGASGGIRNAGSELTLFRKVLIQGEFKGIVAINLKEEELFARLHPPHRSELERARFIVDLDGDILYSVSGGGFDATLVQDAVSQPGEESLWDFRHNGVSYLVNRLVSPLTGWQYVSFVSQDSLLARSKHVRDVVMSVSAAALLLGVLTVVYIQSVAFRPVRRIQRLFRQSNRDIPNADLLHLERLTTELLSDHAQLSQLIRQTMPEASSKYLFDIYMGNVSSIREMREKWSSYFQDWTDEPLTFVVVSIDRYEAWARRYPSADHSLLKFAIANVTAELFSPEWRTVCADFGKDKLALLLQRKRASERREEACREACRHAAEVVHRMLGFSVSMGVSAAHADAGKLKQAMLEADNALGYRLFRGYESVILFADVSDHEPSAATMKDQWLDDLAGAIEAGDEARSVAIVERMAEELRTAAYYPSDALKLLKSSGERLRRIGLREDAEDWAEEGPFEELHTLSLDDIASLFASKAAELSERYRSLMESKDFVLCLGMVEFMKRHLGEPIGIQEIADAAGVSVSLASQLFKQEMDETIYGYFTKLRMDRAGELLVETEDKISDIALKVGYQHENSFIRVFRKYKNITPGKYREMMKFRSEAANVELRGRDELESKGNRVAP